MKKLWLDYSGRSEVNFNKKKSQKGSFDKNDTVADKQETYSQLYSKEFTQPIFI